MRVRLFAGLSLAAALLAAFAALQALPLQAQTTPVTLVSNAHLSPSAFPNELRSAQKFTTGTETDGYVISEVGIHVRTGGGGRRTTVTIRENNSSNRPGDLVDTLTNPLTFTNNDVNTFTAAPNLTLMANTDYWVSVNEGTYSINTSQVRFDTVQNDAQTGQAGWEIGNNRLWRTTATGTWDTGGPSLMIEVRGTVRIVSSDATLSGLSLEDASNGSAIALSPGFSSGHLDYSASVGFPVSQVTVIPTKNDVGASIRYLNDNDEELGDGDRFQLSTWRRARSTSSRLR